MKNSNNLPDLFEKTCPFCSKKFIPAPEHAYRVEKRLYCSWHCYLSVLRMNENRKKNYNQRVVEMYDQSGSLLERFASARDAAERLGFRVDSIRECCRREAKTYKGYVWRYAGEYQNG